MQLEVTEGMLKLALHFANSFGVSSFALDSLGSPVNEVASCARGDKTPPGFTTQSELQEMFRVSVGIIAIGLREFSVHLPDGVANLFGRLFFS